MTVILYNPRAHSDAGEAETRKWVEAHGERVEDMVNILDIEDMGAYVSSLSSADRLFLCGGDGTLTRFADAIRHVNVRVPIYLTAVGTGNDFFCDVRHSGIYDEPLLINQYLHDLPVVYVNGEEHVFVNGIGYGIDGWCAEMMDEYRKRTNKLGSYIAIAAKGLMWQFSPRNATVIVDGVEYHYERVWLAASMNGRFYGGHQMITPNQDRLNPERTLTFAIVHDASRFNLLPILPKLSKGKHTTYTKYYTTFEAHEITVRFDTPCALQRDGETVREVYEYTVRSAPAAAQYERANKTEEAHV